MAVTLFYPTTPIAGQAFTAFGTAASTIDGSLVTAGLYQAGGGYFNNALVQAGDILDNGSSWVVDFPVVPSISTATTFDLTLVFQVPGSDEFVHTSSLTLNPSLMTAVASTITYPTPGLTLGAANVVSFGTITPVGSQIGTGVLRPSAGADLPPDFSIVRGRRWVMRWLGVALGNNYTVVEQGAGEGGMPHTAGNLTIVANPPSAVVLP